MERRTPIPAVIAKIVMGAKVLANGRPKSQQQVLSLLRGKCGLEIGGPSGIFRRWINLPVYDVVGALDNCNFSRQTTWSSHTEHYHYSRKKTPGKIYVQEASDLSQIEDASYDFLLSSHNLEHLANPIKCLKEWQRIVKPGGYFVIALPHYAHTFDRFRPLTTVEHMIEDYRRGTNEDDLTHLEDTVEGYVVSQPPQTKEELRALFADNIHHRMMHHHVFDEVNSRALLEAAGLRVLATECQLPFHIYHVAQKPQ